MPHALTERQNEYLQFLRNYIQANESTPRLEEVADHFGVKPSTANKTLDKLQKKGYLIFRRDSVAGYFIRLAERGGGIEKIIEIMIVGKIDRYGEVLDFPDMFGHLPIMLMGVDEFEVFAQEAIHDIPNEDILAGDHLICDYGIRPQPGDLSIIPFGLKARRWFLCRMESLTLHRNTPWLEVSNPYPMPSDLINEEYGQKYNWVPIAYDENTKDYYFKVAEEESVPMGPIPPGLVMATVLRMSRTLSR